MYIDYVATRELVGSGLDELEADIQKPKRISLVELSESVSMSGINRETQLDRYEFKWEIRTVPVPIANLDRWREFFASVLAGETFSIDIFGSKATPDNPITASLIKGTWSETRLSPQYYEFSLEVLERQ